MRSDEQRLRTLATILGWVSIGIGGMLALAPRLSGRLYGLPIGREPTAPVMFRAAGARDVVVNVGLISAAQHGGNYTPWVLARALSDGADVLAVLLTVGAGARDPRTFGLGALPLLHTTRDVLLWRAARRAGAPTTP